MTIQELRILPPIAIGRLGSSPIPLAAFDLAVNKEKPLDYREIIPDKDYRVDPATGIMTAAPVDTIIFKDIDPDNPKKWRIRPVAPFLEVFVLTAERPDTLIPLTKEVLNDCGFTIDDISWNVSVGNFKMRRRTGNEDDEIVANLQLTDHKLHPLAGECKNFLKGKTVPLGTVQFISPSDEFPEIRLRFTPAAGRVYGSSLQRHTSSSKTERDEVIENDSNVIYDESKSWKGYKEGGTNPLFTVPAFIFAGYSNDKDEQVSWGYFDDTCDGVVTVSLVNSKGIALSASAWITAGPPAFAPDTLPIRAVTDELEQILEGPEIHEEVPIEDAEDIVRRALETVRLMNTAAMNGNPIDGRWNITSTMVRQDTNDFGRYYEPIMAPSLVDNLAVLALHDRVFSALSTGVAPWFSELLRRPEEIGDLSNKQRRKMPAMMRGADGRALTLTRRQIDIIIHAATSSIFVNKAPRKESDTDPLQATNLTAQLHYLAKGNPYPASPRTAISNCYPGLEFDFRNLWRRAFGGY